MSYPPQTPNITGKKLADMERRIEELEKRQVGFGGGAAAAAALGPGAGAAAGIVTYTGAQEHQVIYALPVPTFIHLSDTAPYPEDGNDYLTQVKMTHSATFSKLRINGFLNASSHLDAFICLRVNGVNTNLKVTIPHGTSPLAYTWLADDTDTVSVVEGDLVNLFMFFNGTPVGGDDHAAIDLFQVDMTTGGGVSTTPPPSGGNGVINATVKDHATSAVIPGATVTLSSLSGKQLAQAATNTSGQCKFSSLVDGTYVLNASKSGYDQSSTDATITNGNTQNVTVYLDATTGVQVTVYVQDASDGSYISNAPVTLKNDATGTTAQQTTDGGSAGPFSISQLGLYDITASHAGYNPNTITENIYESDHFTVALTRIGYHVMVQVVDAVSGADLAAALVSCSDGENTPTDGSGLAYFVLPSGTYTFTGSRSGYQSATVGPITINQDMDGQNGHVSGLLIRLNPINASINVNVRKYVPGSGAYLPASSVGVDLLLPSGVSVGIQTTDASGNCTFTGLTPSQTYSAVCSVAGYQQTFATGVASCSLQLTLLPIGTQVAITLNISGPGAACIDANCTSTSRTDNYAYGSTIVLNATPTGGHQFRAWYNSATGITSEQNPMSMPATQATVITCYFV